jgi:LPS-assembly protein
MLASMTYKITPNWSMMGAARSDIQSRDFDQYLVGLGYIDDCFSFSVNYLTDFNYGYSPVNANSVAVGTDHTVILQMSLRTSGLRTTPN